VADAKKGATLASKASVAGSKVAQGWCALYGWDRDKNFTDALQILTEASQGGSADAGYLLGIMYEEGWGIEKDPKLAITFFKAGAIQKHVPSMARVADAYRDGYAVDKDVEKSIDMIKGAATGGHVASMTKLGQWYEKGINGCEENTATAIEWFDKAAKLGDKTAEATVAAFR